MTCPEIGSRWQDRETKAESLVEVVEPPTGPFDNGKTLMIVIRYTFVPGEVSTRTRFPGWHVQTGTTERMAVETFMYFWDEFVPTCWKRLLKDEEECRTES